MSVRDGDGAGHYEALRRQHVADMESRLPEHVARLTWSAERIGSERAERLGALLRVASEKSSWHRERLRHIDIDRVGEPDLAYVPVMTKDDVMEHFDGIVTDPRLTLELVEAHLEGLSGDAYLLDRYHVIASGGSSGRRGVFVYDWEGWIVYHLGIVRRALAERRLRPGISTARDVVVMVTADRASHGSVARSATFASPTTRVHHVPVSLPLDRLVAELNRLRPTTLMGYPSALRWLAGEAEGGRLRIAPRRVRCAGEPLLPEIRHALATTWGAPVDDVWVASETGALAESCPEGAGLHLNEDLVIVEPVDERGEPVPPGCPAAKILVTNLFNLAFPLVRYELTDRVTVAREGCPCGSSYRLVEKVEGRLDDMFVYAGGCSVHPFVFRSVLGAEPGVAEYQVRQTARGAAVVVVPACPRSLDGERVARAVAARLAEAGLGDPEVTVEVTGRLERLASGKLRRFVPLT